MLSMFDKFYRAASERVQELIDAFMLAINQWVQDLQTWMIGVLQTIASHVLNMLGYWVEPLVNYMTKLLPDPTGVGFRYVFEAYHFAGAWFDFDALYYVIVALVTVHMLVGLLAVVNFALLWIYRLWEAIPLN